MIAVDWVYGATAAYSTAVENVTKLALEIFHLIEKLLVGVNAILGWRAWQEAEATLTHSSPDSHFYPNLLWKQSVGHSFLKS